MLHLNRFDRKYICGLFLAVTFLLIPFSAISCDIHVNDVSLPDDYHYDGYYINGNGCLINPDLYRLEEILPVYTTAPTNNTDIAVLVNGANNSVRDHYAQMMLLAEYYDRPILGLHNGAHSEKKRHELREMFQPNNNVVKTIIAAFKQRVAEDGNDFRIIGLSQGAIYISRALSEIKAELTNEVELLSQIQVETFGGAENSFVYGPQYVHYANKKDPVTKWVGVLSPFNRLSKGTIINVFNKKDESCFFFTNPDNEFGKVHSLCSYAKWWKPFEQARKVKLENKIVKVHLDNEGN